MTSARRGFAARKPALSPAEARARWSANLETSRALAEDKFGELADERRGLLNATRDLTPSTFPVRWLSALTAAEAFWHQARAFAFADTAEVRVAIAPALAAASRACRALIDMDERARVGAAQAAIGRQLGEHDD